MKPGVTGWAQVKYRYGSSVEDAMEKLRYDLYYIKHLSLVFDLTIVLDTVKVIVCRKGRAVTRSASASPTRRRRRRRHPDRRAQRRRTRYLAIGVEALIGLVVLPFNVAHLGTSAYGLWMLTASVTAYFSVLDLGYSAARSSSSSRSTAPSATSGALNEILSTMFVHLHRRSAWSTYLRRHRARGVHGARLPALAGADPRRPHRAADHQRQRRGRDRRSASSAASSTASSATT